MEELSKAMLNGDDITKNESLAPHAEWADMIKKKYADLNESNITEILRTEIGLVFSKVLEHAGVYPCTPKGREGFWRFIESVR